MTYDILTDARAWLAERGERERTHTEDCHHWHADCLVSRLADEVDRLRIANCDTAPQANPTPDKGSVQQRAEIERLRGYRDEAEAEASIASLVAERRRLTDEERGAIEYFVRWGTWEAARPSAATLRALLERLPG